MASRPSANAVSMTITPDLDGQGHCAALHFTVLLRVTPPLSAGALLMHTPPAVTQHLVQHHDGASVDARDWQGPLRLAFSEAKGHRRWVVPGRPTKGDIVLSFSARPLLLAPGSPQSTRFALLADAGGLVGVGAGMVPEFLPRLVAREFRTELSWQFPDGWHANAAGAFSTLGSPARSISLAGPPMALSSVVYAVGPNLRTWPTPPQPHAFGVCWMGKLPTKIKDQLQPLRDFYEAVSRLFDGYTHNWGGFTIFLRRAPTDHRTEGCSFAQSFLLTYHEKDIEDLSADEIFHRFARAIMEGRVDLDGPDESSPRENRPVWFNKGIFFLSSFPCNS